MQPTLIIALVLATGKRFLGFSDVFVVVSVGIATGENGLATVKETILRIAHAMGIDPHRLDNLFISEKLPHLITWPTRKPCGGSLSSTA